MSHNFSDVELDLLDKYGSIAKERELRRELTRLDRAYTGWKADEITTFEMNRVLHGYHKKESEIQLRYASAETRLLSIASAIDNGLLERSAISEADWPHLEKHLLLLRDSAAPG